MTPEQKQEQINQLQHTQTVVARSGFGIRKAAELVASENDCGGGSDWRVNEP